MNSITIFNIFLMIFTFHAVSEGGGVHVCMYMYIFFMNKTRKQEISRPDYYVYIVTMREV